ncbi:glycosyltransferase family 4 protein [Massilia niabensis]|uniref:Glycosyltransferase family 4 protein n=1 Tax=Massilia niabensis TaxID=544910 RepID=A0ABW0L6E7_9BURK
MTIWLDVTTTRGWSRPALGIVRVEAETARQFLQSGDPGIRFCRFDLDYDAYFEVGREELTFALARLDAGGEHPAPAAAPVAAPAAIPAAATTAPLQSPWRRWAARGIAGLPAPLQAPARGFARARLDGLRGVRAAARELRRSAGLLWHGSPPAAGAPAAAPAPAPAVLVKPDILFGPGDVYVSLGLDWDQKNLPYLYELKQQLGLRILLMCYDIIPIRLPHLCVADVAAKFSRYFLDVARCADRIACISEYSRADLRKFLEASKVPVPELGVVRLGCEIASAGGVAPSPQVAEVLGRRFILFVSTIERRKNHETLYRAYTRLVDAGVTDLPLLVFVGMAGWGMNDLMTDLRLDPRIRPYLRILNHVSDGDLARLYQDAYFTAYPSLYEGWGLPVAESLAYGKFCLASSAASIPEAGGELIEYVDPWDVPRWAERLRWYIEHPQEVAAREAAIRASYRPASWKDTGTALVEAAYALRLGQAAEA